MELGNLILEFNVVFYMQTLHKESADETAIGNKTYQEQVEYYWRVSLMQDVENM